MRALQEDTEGARAAFASAHHLAPELWVEGYGPDLRALYESSTGDRGQGVIEITPVPSLPVAVDGERVDHFPHTVSAGFHLIQLGELPGRAHSVEEVRVGDGERVLVQLRGEELVQQAERPWSRDSLTGREAQPASVLVGALGASEWGVGFVYRLGTEPRLAATVGAGAAIKWALKGEAVTVLSAQAGLRYYPWGPLYVDALVGPLVWPDTVQARYGPSLGAGLELGRLGMVSIDANLGVGYAPTSPWDKVALRGGVCASFNLGR